MYLYSYHQYFCFKWCFNTFPKILPLSLVLRNRIPPLSIYDITYLFFFGFFLWLMLFFWYFQHIYLDFDQFLTFSLLFKQDYGFCCIFWHISSLFLIFFRDCMQVMCKWHVNHRYGALKSNFVKKVYNLILISGCIFKSIMHEEEGERRNAPPGGRPMVNEVNQQCQGQCDIETCSCARAQYLRMRMEISRKRREIEAMKWRCAMYENNRWKLLWHGNSCSKDARTLAVVDTDSSDESQARGARVIAVMNAGRWGCGDIST